MRRNALLGLLAVAVFGLSILFLPASFAEKNDSVRSHPKKSRSIAKPSLESELFKSNRAASQEPTPGIISGMSVKNDVSKPLREYPIQPMKAKAEEREANENPKLPNRHIDGADPVIQDRFASLRALLTPNMPSPIRNFDGIPFPGVACNCAPPDTDGEVGSTQYVQMVNEGFQVFDKTTGASVFGPAGITTLWTGFGGVCETNGNGDPVVLYDQLADRWVITQFAGTSVPTDECIAVSQTPSAAGAYNRYDFNLGTNFFDYPKLGVWPDGYYMSMNVFNTAGTAFLGPQAFAFDRTKMLAGLPATFVSPGITGGATEDSFLPADLDGSTLPPANAPATFVEWPGTGAYRVFHFHADFAVPANTTFTIFASPAAAAFTELCPTTRACVPELGSPATLDAIGDRLMFRLAYRNFGDHEAVVGNYTVSANAVAGIRWFELRDVTNGPVVKFQESTYQPDTTWRWMGSAAMDRNGSIALGFSASDATINPQIRYAGRLATDPVNTLAQGEAHLFDGTGTQTSGLNRWGDYSDLTIDPVDDCTFWYTQEYIPANGTFNWRTRIGSFKFPNCLAPGQGTAHFVVTDCVTTAPIVGASVSTDGNLQGNTDASGVLDVAQDGGAHTYSVTKPPAYGTSTGNFSITAATTTPVPVCLTGVPFIEAAGSTLGAESCSGANGVIDPNETVTVSFKLMNNGGGSTTNLVATLQSSGGVTPISGPQSYGVIAPGGMAAKNFQFMAGNVSCGGTITATLQLQDGATNLGTVTYNFTTGVQAIALNENFDGVVAPALPAGWVASGTATTWVTSTTTPDSAPNDAFVDDPATVSDKLLETPNMSITSADAQVTFRNNYNLESTFDGGALEVSSPNINAGAYTDITNAAVGGSFVSGGYNGTISASFSNPLAGRQAWTGSSSGYITTVANLGPNVNGQTIKLRWRMGSDSSVAGTAWRIDTIVVSNGFVCCGPLINATPPPVITAESIAPANNAPDPEETVTANFTLTNVGGSPTTNLVATLQPTGGVAGPSGPQTYGVLASSGGTGTRPFTFTAQGTCGNNITATFALQDGALNLGTVSFTMQLGTTAPATTSFSNATSITIPASGTGVSTGAPATPYPSTINVTGLTGTISKVTVDLKGLNHTFPSDVDVLLVGPGGQKFIIMSDVIGGTDWVGINYTLDDAAAVVIPSSGAPASGTFKPTNYGTGDLFPAPAPVAPYQTPATAGSATFASVFNGTNPNGNWDLYVVDDAGGDIGTMTGGWTINITTAVPVCNSQSCTLTVPSNITIPPGTCGTIVNYVPPVSFTGACGVVTTTPASGSFFGIGTTTVNVVGTNGPTTSSFTVTVQDSETLATGSGSNILNNFCDTTVKYANVTAPGSTTVVDAPGQTLPAGFTHCTSCPELNISTTATFTGNVTTCVTMPASTDFATFSRLRLLHGEPVTLVNRTSSSNFGTKTICAVTTSVSPFVVALNTNAPTAAPARISGRIVTSDGQPLGGVALSLSGGTPARAITNSDGNYSFENVATNTFYTVTPERANFSFSPGQRSFSLVADQTDAVFTATADATQTVNPIDSNGFFVRQQYLDFLGREPDADGLNYWTDQLDRCASDANCLRQRRREVSAAYFMSDEFQQSGSYLLGLYRAALGRQISFAEYSTDRSYLVGGAQLETNKVTFTNEWVQRADFQQQYPKTLSNAEFVNRLFDTAGSFSVVERQQAIELLNQGGTRAQVLRGLVDSDSFRQREYNGAFVLMEYFGYLRRDRDQGGYDFWLNVLNNREPGNYRGMVCSFVTAAEYQRRFGTVVTHTNSECGP